MDFTVEQLAVACDATLDNARRHQPWAQAACDKFEIATSTQLSAFLGTCSIESARLTKFEEDLYYRDAERLAGLFRRVFDLDHNGAISYDEIEKARPYCRMPKELSLKLYGGYHGRGAIQLTWEKNYKLHGDRLGYDYVRNPEWVAQPEHAWLTAASFWDLNGCNAVAHDMDEVTRRVNGPRRLHLAERIAQRNRAMEALA